ncbi:hypothetical protein AB6A63_01655, partial ['Camptotheca acuminata' phytoplasma]
MSYSRLLNYGPPYYHVILENHKGPADICKLEQHQFDIIFTKMRMKETSIVQETPVINLLQLPLMILSAISSLILMIYIFSAIWERSMQSRSRAQNADKQKSLFTLKDVAGNKEEKEEMKELIDFLNNPHKYQKMGAVIPKG